MRCSIDPEEKSEKMKEWWSKAHDLLIKMHVKQSDIVQAVKESDIRIRDDQPVSEEQGAVLTVLRRYQRRACSRYERTG